MTRSLISLLYLFPAMLPLGAASPFPELMDDETNIVLAVRDVSALRDSWERHPLAEFVRDAQLADFFQSLASGRSKPEAGEGGGMTEILESEFNLSWSELVDLFPGQIGLSFHNLAENFSGDNGRPDFALMAEFSGSAARMEELMQVQFDRNAAAHKEREPLVEHELTEESFMGETLFFDQVFDGEDSYVEDGYALVEGVFVLATPESRLRSVVEWIKEGPRDSLATTEGYQRVRDAAPVGDVMLYFNFERLMPAVNAALKDPELTSGLAMLGITGNGLERAMALETLLGFGLDLRLTERGIISHSGLIFREKAGLLRLLTYGPGELPAATFVPERILSSSISKFDLTAMLANLETFMASVSPSVGPLFDIQLQQLQSQSGIDLRSSVLNNFGSEMVTLSVLPQSRPESAVWLEPEQLFAIAIRDADALSLALEALKDQVPGMRARIETSEFQGKTIHRIIPPSDPNRPEGVGQEVSYAITRSHLLVNVGRIGLIHEVLGAMQRGGEGFWQLGAVRDSFRPIARPNPVTRSYFDVSEAVGPTLQSLMAMRQMTAPHQKPAMELPENLVFPYELLSEMNEADGAFFGRSLLHPKTLDD